MNRTERGMVAEVERISAMMGLPEVTVARMLDSEAREAVAEDRRREAERQAAIERGQDAVWAHQHANAELGLPADTSMAERLQLLNPMSDGVTRDPSAPYRSASNPAFFVNAGGVPVDIGYQAQQAKASAQRSFTEAHDDALIARAREQSRDTFMVIECQRFHQRQRAREAARAAADAPAAPAARSGYEPSGVGWPETGGGYPLITR